jgi:hypothetical protein
MVTGVSEEPVVFILYPEHGCSWFLQNVGNDILKYICYSEDRGRRFS